MVRFVTQRVEEQNVEPLQTFHRGGRDFAVVRKVGNVSEAESENRFVSVRQRNGFEWQPRDVKRSLVDQVHIELRDACLALLVIECVAENPLEDGEGLAR